MNTIDTIDLTERSRILVVTDEDAENPRNDYAMTGFVKIANRGDSRLIDVLPVHEDYNRIEEAHSHFLRSMGISHYTDILYRAQDKAIELTERWAKVFLGKYIEYDHEHGGFWFVDNTQLRNNFPATHTGQRAKMVPMPGLPYKYTLYSYYPSMDIEKLVIEQEQETYRTWADGEVVGLVLERKHTWARTDGAGDTRDEWEAEESIWGIWPIEGYPIEREADGYFDLTSVEQAALRARW